MSRPRCTCGMHMLPEEDKPMPFTLAWQIAHRDLHLLMFPGADQITRDNLDLFVEEARVKAGLSV